VKICRPQKFAALGYSPLSPPVNQALIVDLWFSILMARAWYNVGQTTMASSVISSHLPTI